MKYAFIFRHKKTWPVGVQCKVLGVCRNSYYSYQRRQALRPPDPEQDVLLHWVKRIAKASDDTYGSRRMKEALGALGYVVSRDKARNLMRETGVEVRFKKRFKITTNSHHQLPLFENVLDRQFEVAKPDQVYVSDITYIWTQEGWLYLAVVIDLFSRRIVGWSIRSRMTARLVCDALTMAIWQRRPAPGLIHHSDRGSQYASHLFRKLLADYHIIGSMRRKGNCWDNSVAESFFGSLKQERVQWRHYQTRHEAQQDVLQYILFYNSQRLHSCLDYKSPNQYESEMAILKKAA